MAFKKIRAAGRRGKSVWCGQRGVPLLPCTLRARDIVVEHLFLFAFAKQNTSAAELFRVQIFYNALIRPE